MLRVFRTQSAITRSPRPCPPYAEIPESVRTSVAPLEPSWSVASTTAPKGKTNTTAQHAAKTYLPRGGLAYYRDIPMASVFNRFCVKVEHEGTRLERVVLALMGEQQVALWDLDDVDAPAEVIDFPHEHPCRIEVSTL